MRNLKGLKLEKKTLSIRDAVFRGFRFHEINTTNFLIERDILKCNYSTRKVFDTKPRYRLKYLSSNVTNV